MASLVPTRADPALAKDATPIPVRALRTPVRWPRTSGSALLLPAWAAIGLGSALREGTYSVAAISLVTAGTALLLIAVLSGAHDRRGDDRVVAVAAAMVVLASLEYPGVLYASGSAWHVCRLLTIIAAAAVTVCMITQMGDARAIAAGAIMAMAAAGAALVIASPKPPIDVWY